MLWARGMSNKTKDKIVFRDLARKFEWFTDEIGDMEVQSIIIPDDLPKIIEVFGVLNKKRVYVKIHMHRSTLDLQEVMHE